MAGGGGGEQELNLVPYLDIMVNLIMFLLLITANIVELKEAPVLAPKYVPPSQGGASDPNAAPNLTVLISAKGFGVLSAGGREVPPADIPMVGGKYDYARLTSTLKDYKEQYEPSENLTLVPEAKTQYRVVVETMDAARGDKKTGPIFPGVTLATAVGVK